MTAGPALEMWSRQTGTAEHNDAIRSVTMQRAFTMTLDVTDRLEIAYSALGLPLVDDVYPDTFSIICKKINAQRVSPIMAIVTCDYAGETGPEGQGDTPVGGEPSIEWGGTTTDEAIDEDFSGFAMLTANGESIDGITERLTDDTCTIERNFLSVNRYALRAYRRAVNSDVFLGWPPGTVRMIDDNAKAVFVDGIVKYWKVRAVFQFREPFRTTAEKAWYKRVRHEGYYVRDTAGGPTRIAWDETGKTPTTKPVLLRANGTQIPRSNTILGSAEAEWLQFQTLGSLPFNSLGLV